MALYRRRTLLTGLASLVVLSGCSLGGDKQTQSPSLTPDETATLTPSSTKSGNTVSSQTWTPDIFADLTIDTDQTWCPSDNHWEPYYHRTPIAPPDRPSNATQGRVTEYVNSYEAYVLTYLAVDEYGQQTPSPPTPTNRPEVPEFPDTDMQDSTITVLSSLKDKFIIQISYTRFIEGESRGRYTVNYYVSPEKTIRAEAEGDVSPGPNPTKSGLILEC